MSEIIEEEKVDKYYFKKLNEFPKIDLIKETEMIDYIGHGGPIKRIIPILKSDKYSNCFITISNDKKIMIWNINSNSKEKEIKLNFQIEDIILINDNIIAIGEAIVKYNINSNKIITEIRNPLTKGIEYKTMALINDDYILISSLSHFFLLLDISDFNNTYKISMYNVHYICSIENEPPYIKKEDDIKSNTNDYNYNNNNKEEEQETTKELVRSGSGKCLSTIQGHKGNVYMMLTLNNDKYKNAVITAGEDLIIKIMSINISTIKNESIEYTINDLEGHTASVSAITLLNNNTLISGSYDWTIRIWDLNTLQCVGDIHNNEYHRSSISFISVLNEGKYFMTGGLDRKINLFDNNGNKLKKFIYTKSGIIVSVVEYNNSIIFGDNNGNIFIEKLIE